MVLLHHLSNLINLGLNLYVQEGSYKEGEQTKWDKVILQGL